MSIADLKKTQSKDSHKDSLHDFVNRATFKPNQTCDPLTHQIQVKVPESLVIELKKRFSNSNFRSQNQFHLALLKQRLPNEK